MSMSFEPYPHGDAKEFPRMTLTRTNAIIAAVIALVNSIIPFLQIIGVLHLTTDGLAALYLIVSNAGTLAGLIFASSPVTNTPDA